MIKMSFLKIRKPRQYDYYPRYYDPDKEDLEKRIAQAKAEVRSENDSNIRREITFRRHVSESWKPSTAKEEVFKTNLRLLIIFVIACIAFYFIYGEIDNYLENYL